MPYGVRVQVSPTALKVMKTKFLIIFILLILLGAFLRFYKLDQGLIFSYDQARDAYRAQSITKNKDLKLLGPETDIPGVYHGVGYYYLLAIPYALFEAPVAAGYFHGLLHLVGVPLIYFTAQSMFGKKRISFLAALLFVVSYEMVQYARWLSNPALATITTLIVYWSTWEWIKRNSPNCLIISIAAVSLSLHFQFFLIYLYLWPVFIWFIFKPKVTLKSIIGSIASALAINLPFILAEFKFGLRISRGLFGYVLNQTSDYASITTFFLRYWDRFISVFYHTVGPFNSLGMLLLVIFFFGYFRNIWRSQKKSKSFRYLFYWMFSSFPIFAFATGAVEAEFSFVGVAFSFILFTALILNALYNKPTTRIISISLLSLFLGFNLLANLKNPTSGVYLYTLKRPVTYALETQVIDYTYKSANYEPFTICTVTNPLFYNTVWSYLYESYGRSKYGYLPFWAGQLQPPGLSNLPSAKTKTTIRFLIYEPELGIPGHAFTATKALEDLVSDITETTTIGDFKIEKRELLTSEAQKIKRDQFPPYYLNTWEKEEYMLYRCF